MVSKWLLLSGHSVVILVATSEYLIYTILIFVDLFRFFNALQLCWRTSLARCVVRLSSVVCHGCIEAKRCEIRPWTTLKSHTMVCQSCGIVLNGIS